MKFEWTGADYTQHLIFIASFLGHADVVDALISAGADVTQINSMKHYASLHMASMAGSEVVVELFLENGAAVDVRDTDMMTPLHHAAERGRAATARVLLRYQADINAKDMQQRTPLVIACRNDLENVDMLRLLFKHVADSNIEDKDGYTPLLLACSRSRQLAVQTLLEQGIDPNEQNRHDGYSPLHYAAWSRWEKMTDMLIAYGRESMRQTSLDVRRSILLPCLDTIVWLPHCLTAEHAQKSKT